MEPPSRKIYSDAQFIEGWMSGTYVVTGIFAIPSGNELNEQTINENIPVLYSKTNSAKRGFWPRGIAGTFIFPFYLGSRFQPEVVAWVQKRHKYRWAIWHEPILYDLEENSVMMRADYGLYGGAFRPLVANLHFQILTAISEKLGQRFPCFINGRPTSNAL